MTARGSAPETGQGIAFELTDKRIRRGSFLNVPAPIAAIKDYLDNHNQNPRVFVWSAPVERILKAFCSIGKSHGKDVWPW